MLSDPLLSGLVDSGGLRLWAPLPGVSIKAMRTLLLTPEVFEEVYKERWPRELEDKSAADARDRRLSLHAAMTKFAVGGVMTPDYDVKSLATPDDAVFEDLFEIRSGPPRPQSRLLVYAFSPGVWVAVGFRLRSDLGEKGDPRWSAAAAETRARWVQLFAERRAHALPKSLTTVQSWKAVSNA